MDSAGVDAGKRASCREARPTATTRAPPTPPVQVTKLGKEMSLRFLKKEAKLCGFLQKSSLAREQVGAGTAGWAWVSGNPCRQCVSPKRVKASGCVRLKAESRLQGEPESRQQPLSELTQQLCRPCRGSWRWAAVAAAWGHWGLRAAPHSSRKKASGWAAPGPGQGCGPVDQVGAAEPAVAGPRLAGHAGSLARVPRGCQGVWEAVGGQEPSLRPAASEPRARPATPSGGASYPPGRGTGLTGILPGQRAPVTTLRPRLPGFWRQQPGSPPWPSAEGQSRWHLPPGTPGGTWRRASAGVGERAAYPQESLEAMRLAWELAQWETLSALKLVRARGWPGSLEGPPRAQAPTLNLAAQL